jgi:hypothetical protein
MDGQPVQITIDCNAKNFPVKSFYNDEKDEIYVFYRQGQSYTIDGKDISKFFSDNITDEDLGQMVLVYNKILVIKSSGKILFMKMEYNEVLMRKQWKLYKEFEIRGFIYHIKGNIRLQVTADDKIYFFLIDQETLDVTL